MTRRGLVLGCGGTVGGAWQVGALQAIAGTLGWDPATADVIVGTSSGAHLATMLGSGVSVDELVAAQFGHATAPAAVRRFFTEPPPRAPRLPRPSPPALQLVAAGLKARSPLLAASGLLPQGRSNPQFLDDLTDALVPSGGWLHHRATWLVGVDAQSGQRVAFGSPAAPPVEARDALRASWAIPGWYPPVMIGGRSYLDGGIASPTSADLLADEGLDEIVIVSPMASTAHVPGLLGRAEAVIRESMRHTLEAEIAILEARGIRVTAVLPSRDELSVMGFNFMDPRRRLAALDAALTHLPSRLAAQREGATL